MEVLNNRIRPALRPKGSPAILAGFAAFGYAFTTYGYTAANSAQEYHASAQFHSQSNAFITISSGAVYAWMTTQFVRLARSPKVVVKGSKMMNIGAAAGFGGTAIFGKALTAVAGATADLRIAMMGRAAQSVAVQGAV
jgi:hypothetical protein